MKNFDLKNAATSAKTRLDLTAAIFLSAIHLGAIAAFFFCSWKNFFAFFILYVISGTGITIGYHRLLAHRSFKTPAWWENVLATCGALALQGGPITWIAQHRQHHNSSDTTLDPHDINKGFLWAHMWWVFSRYPKWYEAGQRDSFAPDLQKSTYLMWLEKYQIVPSLILGIALVAIGGWSMALWGICLRLICVYHSTWFVNSAAHKWGYRPFKNEIATNNWWVALLTFGEGWHNNHHQFPTSARHGLRGWEVDFSWISIWLMSKLGMASKIRLPRQEELPWIQRENERKTSNGA